jgi:hypothetical protein
MHIVAVAWIYVVLMMSITEHSLIAGIMTFLLYGVLPLTIILYLAGTRQCRRRRLETEKLQEDSGPIRDAQQKSEADDSSENN